MHTQHTLNSNAGSVSSLGNDKAPAEHEDGPLHCVVSRSDGFLFLNNATASSIAADIARFIRKKLPSIEDLGQADHVTMPMHGLEFTAATGSTMLHASPS